MSAVEIYASLPSYSATGSRADCVEWSWVHCLTLPLKTLNNIQFSRHPYKWMRYTIGTVLGAEGDLSTSRYSNDTVNYDEASLPAETASLYYHMRAEERQRLFPVDPEIYVGRSDTVPSCTSSMYSTPGDTFREKVGERDQRRCVITKMIKIACDAAHIIPQTKGDHYIETYTKGRSRDPAGGDIVNDIDSIRNGLFLDKACHPQFGLHMAILETPNFALNSADIDPTVAPSEKRWTFHIFKDVPAEYRCFPRSGSEVRMNRDCDPSQNPPAILLDAVYASAVLHHFATPEFKAHIAMFSNNTYHPETSEQRAQRKELIAQQKEDRAREREMQPHEPDVWDLLLNLTYLNQYRVPSDEVERLIEAQEKAEEEEEEEKRYVHDKVRSWIEQANNS